MRSLIFIILVSVVSGCASCGAGKHVPSLTAIEAVEIANNAVLKNGINLEKYHAPEAHFEYVEANCEWFIHYEGKSNFVGNHFGVIVDDKSHRVNIGTGI